MPARAGADCLIWLVSISVGIGCLIGDILQGIPFDDAETIVFQCDWMHG
jgi:hypothetical protein